LAFPAQSGPNWGEEHAFDDVERLVAAMDTIGVLGRPPLWHEDPTNTMLQVFVGVNIETLFMFAIAGVVFTKLLPSDPKSTILGWNSRWMIALLNSMLCVGVEIFLHHAADRALGWSYWWWSAQWPWLIIFAYWLVFHVPTVLVYDCASSRVQLTVVFTLFVVDVAMTIYCTVWKHLI